MRKTHNAKLITQIQGKRKSSECERVNTMNKWNIEYRMEKTNELVFWLVVEADSEEMALSESERLFNQPRRYTTKRGTIVATAIQAEGDNSAWLASVRAEMKGE